MRKLILTHLFLTASIALVFFCLMANLAFADDWFKKGLALNVNITLKWNIQDLYYVQIVGIIMWIG